MTFNYHTDSARAIEFSPDGNMIYTASKDQSIGVISAGCLQGHMQGAHPAPIHTICHVENGHILASGDDDGMIRIWDLR